MVLYCIVSYCGNGIALRHLGAEIPKYFSRSIETPHSPLNQDNILEVIARWTGIPVQRLSQSQAERLLTLGEKLHERVVGQDDAVSSVAEV